MIKFILDVLRILTTPSCWIRLGRSNAALSRWINLSLDKGLKPTNITRFTCTLNGKELWIENYPYAYGCVYNKQGTLPDRTTVFRLKEAVDAAEFGLDD